MKFSIIVPAHNEEKFITKCLASIINASKEIEDDVEIIVVLNRCTDKTEEIAKQFGAITIINNEKNLSKIRNAGVNASTGEVVITIDADSWMKSNMLREIKKNVGKDKYIGGGVQVRPERVSLGIFLSLLICIVPVLIRHGISGGLFWCDKKTFQELGGFDDNLLTAEDIDFAIRLKRLGKASGRKFKTINTSFIVTSCRKCDQFGDWYILKNRGLVKDVFTGKNREIADKWWYDVKR